MPPPGGPPGGRPPWDPVGTVRRWFGEGNVPVKVGVVVLFAGVAALLKYAAEMGWLRVPIEFRLAGIAAAAVTALAFGFRQRVARRTFALSVQGGAIGILVLTVFAAFRLYDLLPQAGAFALLVILTAGAGALAVAQDSRALAVLGILAGFLAPILVSEGSRNHVALFSWYAILDVAIAAVAWFKAWRGLNLLGFLGTFAVGTAWGVLSYEPAKFGSTEPFLVLFFLLFLAIPVLHGRRDGRIDGTLVFGNPLVVMALQAALLEGERLPLAYTALAMALIYLGLAAVLVRREATRVLGESHAVLAVGFATLAVPLALSAGATAGVFALEGAALAWLGFRQGRLLPKVSGFLLEGAAAIAHVVSLVLAFDHHRPPIVNGPFAGGMLLVVGALASAWLYHRRATGPARHLASLFFLVGLFWWTVTGLLELDAHLEPDRFPDALLAFTSLTAWLSAEAGRRFRAPLPSWIAAVALWLALPLALAQIDVGEAPYTPWGLAAWAAFAAAGLRCLACLREAEGARRFAHLAWLWAWPVAAGLSLRDVAARLDLGESWRDAALVLPLAVLHGWFLLGGGAGGDGARRSPTALARFDLAREPLVRRDLLGLQAFVLALGFVVFLAQPGDAAPLAFLPLLNPQDLLGIAWGVIAAAYLGDPATPRGLAAGRLPLLSAGGFLLLTAATLRAVHHLGGEPWNVSLAFTAAAQAALAVVWSILGVAGWVLGSRRSNRQVWLAGAVLMGVVLLKLLVVDRQHLGNLAGIVAFLAYGLLCTVVGYLAPAPPRSPTAGAPPGATGSGPPSPGGGSPGPSMPESPPSGPPSPGPEPRP